MSNKNFSTTTMVVFGGARVAAIVGDDDAQRILAGESYKKEYYCKHNVIY